MPGLFLPRSRPWLWATAAERWFGTCSCKPIPRGLPSSDKQLRAIRPHGLSRSWRTITGNPEITPFSWLASAEEQPQILRRCAPLDDKRNCEYRLDHRPPVNYYLCTTRPRSQRLSAAFPKVFV